MAMESKCELCGQCFRTARGLTKHIILAHATQHHSDGAATLQLPKSKHLTTEEWKTLGRLKLLVIQEGYGSIGLVRTLANRFRERTFESIKSQRQHANYLSVLAELREEPESLPNDAK